MWQHWTPVLSRNLEGSRKFIPCTFTSCSWYQLSAYLQQQHAGPAPTQLCVTAEAPAFDGSDPEVSSGLSTETPWHTTSSLPPRINYGFRSGWVSYFVNSVPINQSHMIYDVTIILDYEPIVSDHQVLRLSRKSLYCVSCSESRKQDFLKRAK